MNRETAINVLLGTILIIACAVPFVVVGAALWLVLYSLDLGLIHFWPGFAVPEVVKLWGLLCLITILSGIRYLRKRFWASALFSFAMIAIPLSGWFRFSHALNSSWPFAWPMILIALIPANQKLRGWECFFLGSLVAFGLALNAGLLGSGILSAVAEFSISIASLAWIIVSVRAGRLGSSDLKAVTENL